MEYGKMKSTTSDFRLTNDSLDGKSHRGQKWCLDQKPKRSNKKLGQYITYMKCPNRNQVLNYSNEENNLKTDNWMANGNQKIYLWEARYYSYFLIPPQPLPCPPKIQFLNFLKSICCDSRSRQGKIASVGNNHSNFLFLSFLVKLLLTIPYLIISRCCWWNSCSLENKVNRYFDLCWAWEFASAKRPAISLFSAFFEPLKDCLTAKFWVVFSSWQLGNFLCSH